MTILATAESVGCEEIIGEAKSPSSTESAGDKKKRLKKSRIVFKYYDIFLFRLTPLNLQYSKGSTRQRIASGSAEQHLPLPYETEARHHRRLVALR
jgi:hypothetical protein